MKTVDRGMNAWHAPLFSPFAPETQKRAEMPGPEGRGGPGKRVICSERGK